MTARTADGLDTLKAHINKHLTMLEELRSETPASIEHDLPMIGRTSRAALLVAGLMESYYTCSETIFARISRFSRTTVLPNVGIKNCFHAGHWNIRESVPESSAPRLRFICPNSYVSGISDDTILVLPTTGQG